MATYEKLPLPQPSRQRQGPRTVDRASSDVKDDVGAPAVVLLL